MAKFGETPTDEIERYIKEIENIRRNPTLYPQRNGEIHGETVVALSVESPKIQDANVTTLELHGQDGLAITNSKVTTGSMDFPNWKGNSPPPIIINNSILTLLEPMDHHPISSIIGRSRISAPRLLVQEVIGPEDTDSFLWLHADQIQADAITGSVYITRAPSPIELYLRTHPRPETLGTIFNRIKSLRKGALALDIKAGPIHIDYIGPDVEINSNGVPVFTLLYDPKNLEPNGVDAILSKIHNLASGKTIEFGLTEQLPPNVSQLTEATRDQDGDLYLFYTSAENETTIIKALSSPYSYNILQRLKWMGLARNPKP